MNPDLKYNNDYFKIITLNNMKDLMNIPIQDLKKFHTRNFKGDLFSKIYKEAVQLEYQKLKKSYNDIDKIPFSNEKNLSYQISPYKVENINVQKIIPQNKKIILKINYQVNNFKQSPKITNYNDQKNFYKNDYISNENNNRSSSSSDNEMHNRNYYNNNNDDNANYIKYKKISSKDKNKNKQNNFKERESEYNKKYYSNNDNKYNHNFRDYRNSENGENSDYSSDEEEEKNSSVPLHLNRRNQYSYYNNSRNNNTTNNINKGSRNYKIEEEKYNSPVHKEKNKNYTNYDNEDDDDYEYYTYKDYNTSAKKNTRNYITKKSINSRNKLFNDNENNDYNNDFESSSLSKSSFDLRNKSNNSNISSIHNKNKFNRQNSNSSSSSESENSDKNNKNIEKKNNNKNNELSADNVTWKKGSRKLNFKNLLNLKKNNDTSNDENDNKEEENIKINNNNSNKNNDVNNPFYNKNDVVSDKKSPITYRNNDNIYTKNYFKTSDPIDHYPIKKLVFNIKYDTRFGENLGISGSISPFGNWNQNKTKALSWNKGNIWTGELEINYMIPKIFEFKFVIIKRKNIIKWESGNNHKMNLDDFQKELNMRTNGKYKDYEYEYNKKEKILNLKVKMNIK